MTGTYLVTGAAGFIGSHLVDRLLDKGLRVIGIDNFDDFYAESEKRANLRFAREHDRFRFVQCDCRDLARLQTEIAGEQVNAIVHLAAKAGVFPSISDPVGYAEANVVGTQAMLELARRAGVRRFVFASSSSVYGNNDKVPFAERDPVDKPISPYAATKRAGELLCHTYHHLFGLSVIALRFFTVYGPRQRPDLAIRKFATRMIQGHPIELFGDGNSERDYTWIDDIIDGVVSAIERTDSTTPEYQIINLGESATTSLRELVDRLGMALDITPRVEWRPTRPGDVQRTFADVTLARALLGYHPRTPVSAGIPMFAEWIRASLSTSAKGRGGE